MWTCTLCSTNITYLKPRLPAHTHSGGMTEEETEKEVLPQQLLQPVSVQMFHLQCLSVPMLLQTGEMDCNIIQKLSSTKFIYRFHNLLLMSVPERRTHLSWHSRQWTSIGSISLSIRASMGGLRSEDRSFRADWTAFSWTTGSSLPALATSCSKFVAARLLSKSSSSETKTYYDDLPVLRPSTTID